MTANFVRVTYCVKCIWIGNQNVVLFPKCRKNCWKAASALIVKPLTIPSHSTTLFTSFFFKKIKNKHIKLFTFYITSFTLYYYSNKKITTK